MSIIIAGIKGDSRTVTAESFRVRAFPSGSQLQSLGVGGDCSVTRESEQTQLCGRSERIGRCEPKYPMPDSPLKSSVSFFTSSSPDDPAGILCPFSDLFCSSGHYTDHKGTSRCPVPKVRDSSASDGETSFQLEGANRFFRSADPDLHDQPPPIHSRDPSRTETICIQPPGHRISRAPPEPPTHSQSDLWNSARPHTPE